MSATSSCPSSERLRQLLSGSMPAAKQAELVAHLDDCAACQQTLDRLAGVDPALLDAASALQRTAYAEEPPLRRVLHDLERDATWPTLNRPATRTAWLQSLLRPADSADALGWLETYQVTELLGQGGMGLVLKAFDPALKRWVALKVLAPDLAGDPVARQRFAREAQAAAAVRHAHVITIHAVSETNGLPFIVMEYVSAGSLQDYLDCSGPPDWRTVARLGMEVASGLAAAHAQGLIHRDIKPSNILLQTDGTATELGVAKIGDFGLARAADEARLTRTGIVPGTPMYMAPEQARSEALDARADLFSLGSVLYTLCTGREPFSGTTAMAVLRQVCDTEPPPIRDLNPAIPDWLAATVARLQAKHPADRFATAAEVEELLRYNLEHPDQPRRVPPPRGRRGRRRRLLWRVGAAAVVGLLLALVFLPVAVPRFRQLAGWLPFGEAQDGRVRVRATLSGHTGPVWSVAFAPDGKTLATGSDDSSLRFWNAASGREIDVRPCPNSPVFAVVFAHNGKFLISGGGDGTLRLWDAATRREQVPSLPHLAGNLRRIPISPDDKTVAVAGSTQGVELWDLPSRSLRQTLSGYHGTIMALAFAPDGQTLATGDANGDVRLWDPVTGSERGSIRADALGLRALAFTPDSRTLASAGTGKDVKLWDVATRHLTATLSGYENGVQCMAISPDGRLLATGSRDGTVKLWDVAAAEALATLHAHQGSVWGVAFSPDSGTLATAGEDRRGKLWDLGGLAGARP